MAINIIELEKRGKQIIKLVLPTINEIKDAVRPYDEYRRESDFREMCIALALFEEIHNEDINNLFELVPKTKMKKG